MFKSDGQGLSLIDRKLKQYFVEIDIRCDLAPPTVSECNTTVINTDPRSVTICQALTTKKIMMS